MLADSNVGPSNPKITWYDDTQGGGMFEKTTMQRIMVMIERVDVMEFFIDDIDYAQNQGVQQVPIKDDIYVSFLNLTMLAIYVNVY